METDQGKLFIGGISWDTNEDRLKEYFGAYGEVVEAVIMRDRTTGRARGFGFVVFAEPAVAERVVKEKHMIDGRTVEAKKAVPRDDQHLINRNSPSVQGSPGQGRTKKIFVGGLASTVTESDFKIYFDQFGTITDVVVMYDHNTQRPRGFGFITYDSEDAVERVLHKTFHELNGKMVEVKRAVPKELSPGPTRSPVVGYNYGFTNRANILNSYGQGYNLSSLGGYGVGVRMDGRYSPLASSRGGFSPFSSPGYGMGVNMENSGFGGPGSNFSGNLGYGRVLNNPYFGSGINNNQSRYASTPTPIGYNMNSTRGDSYFNSPSRNVWGNGGVNNNNNNNTSSSPNNAGNSGSYFGSGSGGFGVFGTIGGSIMGNSSGNVGYRGGGENVYGGFGGRNGGAGVGAPPSSFSASGGGGGGYEGSYGGGEFYRGGSVYGDPTWQTASSQLENSNSFGYGLGNSEDVNGKDSEEYGVGGYDIRQSNRGIAA